MPPDDKTHPIGVQVPITNDADSPSPVVLLPHEEILQVPHKPVVTAPSLGTTPPPVPVEPIPTVDATPAVVDMAAPLPEPTPTPMSIAEEIVLKEKEKEGFVEGRARIEEDSRALFSERKRLEDLLEPILFDEKLAVVEIDTFEKKKLAAKSSEEARAAEKERWGAEEKRRTIEHNKWPISEELDAVVQKIKEVERAFKELSAKEENCNIAIAQLRIKEQQQALRADLEAITKDKQVTEDELAQFRAEHERLEALLRDMTMHDEEALLAEQAVDRQTGGVRTLYEEQVLSAERHKLEDARKEAEQKRWEAEDALPPIEHATEDVKAHLDEVTAKEREIIAKLDALAAITAPPVSS